MRPVGLVGVLALHLTATSALPRTGRLALIDHVYHAAYGVALLSVTATILAARLHASGRPHDARRLDRGSLVALTALYFVPLSVLLAAR